MVDVSEIKRFDTIVLTAANEAQALGYREQLQWRQQSGVLDPAIRVRVITDPGGRRVGSLGATLHVLAELAAECSGSGNPFAGERILICHSGGDSRRTPAYAAQGKVFTPLPVTAQRGEPLALFDLIVRTLSELPRSEGGHVVITSGDVLLTFDHGAVDLTREGVTGVAYFGPAARGERHGVYVPESFRGTPQQCECLPVADFLQKPTLEQAEAGGAVDPFGNVAVDTGLMSIDPATSLKLLEMAGWRGGRGGGRILKSGLLAQIADGGVGALDLYQEFAMALAERVEEGDYIGRFADGGVERRWLQQIYRGLRGVAFHVNVVPYCEFFHIGSSRELLSGFGGLSRTAETYRFVRGSGSYLTGESGIESAFVFNTCLEVPMRAGPSLIEGVHGGSGSRIELERDNILTGLPQGVDVAVTLKQGIGMVCLPIGRSGWAAVAYGVDDDFKQGYGKGGECLFLNQPVGCWMERNGGGRGDLWRGGSESEGMWQARLWRVGRIGSVVAEAVSVGGGGGWLEDQSPGRRYSLAELLPRVNHKRLLAVRQEIHRQVNLHRITERVLGDNELSAAEICREIRVREEAEEVLRRLAELTMSHCGSRPLLRARVLQLMAEVHKRGIAGSVVLPKGFEDPQQAAFGAVAESVALSYTPPESPGQAAILHDQVVWVTTPVRIDFAGGWSDTPPICSELGGTVLNAAVTLNGLYPVQVMAKLNRHGCIRLSSIDLGERVEIRSTAELLDHSNPHEWSTLAKAAIVLAGIGPSDSSRSLAEWLRKIGGGVDLTIFSSLPKGSGMGTSSVLGAAVLACLGRVVGKSFTTDELIRLVSILEQRMCTGGGWQDQVGAIVPGVKLITTQPGSDQSVSLRWAVFNMSEGSELKRRCLLYFTGQKRMARNILQNVVRRYLGRDPETIATVHALKQCAIETKEALDAQDVEGFGSGVARYWELKKRIDPGSTNDAIERLLGSVSDELTAALLPGAGGGGFIFMLARSGEAAERIRQRFEASPPNREARFFEFDIDQQGLRVTCL